MRPEADELSSLIRGRFTYFPVVPGRVEFAAAVHRAIEKARPKVVAVELPSAVEFQAMRAIKRLPEMSLLVYPEPGTNALEEEMMVYVPIEPADPFVEALRTANELELETLFIEPSLGQRPHLPGGYPDPYAVNAIGISKYVEQYRFYVTARSEEVSEHAAGMAYRLQGTDPSAEVFVVLSLNLLDPLLDAMDVPQEEPPAQLTKVRDVQLLNPHPECLAEITTENPFHQARYEAWRAESLPSEYIDRRHVNYALLKEAELFYEANTGDKVQHWQRRCQAQHAQQENQHAQRRQHPDHAIVIDAQHARIQRCEQQREDRPYQRVHAVAEGGANKLAEVAA